jgi:hypothetical protein
LAKSRTDVRPLKGIAGTTLAPWRSGSAPPESALPAAESQQSRGLWVRSVFFFVRRFVWLSRAVHPARRRRSGPGIVPYLRPRCHPDLRPFRWRRPMRHLSDTGPDIRHTPSLPPEAHGVTPVAATDARFRSRSSMRVLRESTGRRRPASGHCNSSAHHRRRG